MSDIIQKNVEILTCPKCGNKLPLMDENGKHNFCPSSEFVKEKIVEICMQCKMEEVAGRWRWSPGLT